MFNRISGKPTVDFGVATIALAVPASDLAWDAYVALVDAVDAAVGHRAPADAWRGIRERLCAQIRVATTTMLRVRRAAHDVFRCGRYEPLAVEGSARQHLFAFGRVLGQRQVLVCVPRLVATLAREGHAPIGEVWGYTRISVPEEAPRCYRQIFTGACVAPTEEDGRKWIRAADVFADFPIAFLEAA